MRKTGQIFAVAAFGIFLRSSLSLHPYSGQNNPPQFGDFEAQRHWQEITIHVPIKSWYYNTTENNLNYWGLDYPPLTAYHSWILGKISDTIDSSFTTLFDSRGITNERHKLYMRLTVLFADLCLYLPAIIAICIIMASEKVLLPLMLTFISYPGQILMDNGHFQYNNISLGLFIWAVIALRKNKNMMASFLFILALNYKQMELYHSLPFFCYLLGLNLKKGFLKGIIGVSSLGFIVVITTASIWSPWIYAKNDLLQLLTRIFPIYRGIFEDKVASFWCVINVFVKIKTYLSNDQLALVCLLVTLIFLTLPCINMVMNPEKIKFHYNLVNSSLIFFLFSFHVSLKFFYLIE